MLYETLDLPFGDHSVEKVKTTILPLHRAVDVQRIAQPIVGGASEEGLIRSIHVFQVNVQIAYFWKPEFAIRITWREGVLLVYIRDIIVLSCMYVLHVHVHWQTNPSQLSIEEG